MLSFVRTGFDGSCSSDSVRATSLFAASRAADPDTKEVMSRASPSAVSFVPFEGFTGLCPYCYAINFNRQN